MKKSCLSLLLLAMVGVPAFASVNVSAPMNNQTTGPNVQFTASATTTCWAGVAAMGIYINNNLVFTADGASLNTSLNLGAGWNYAVVQDWDNCGGSDTTPININVTNNAGIIVSSPGNGATVSSPANFVATATTGCSAGVGAMGVYVNDNLVYTANGASLNAQIPLGAGWNSVVVQDWDNCGGVSKKALSVNVTGSSGNTLWALQGAGGWDQWGELPPTMDTCDAPCNYQVGFSMEQHEGSVSQSGNGTEFDLWGTTPYSAVLFSNPVLGQRSWINSDPNQTLLPKLHNFTYDTDVYVADADVTQALEFDVNLYLSGVGMEWGTQCNHLGDNSWDYWDNVDATWVSSGAPCNLSNGWHHLTLHVQRESDNTLLYQSITWDGTTYTLNQYVAPFQVPSDWYGVTVNYQMDGNYNMSSNTTYLDNFNLTYW